MQASDIAAIAEQAGLPEVSPEAQETAARISALLRHLFLYDRGNQLRVIEESGLSMTQCKALLELGGLGRGDQGAAGRRPGRDVGVSVPSMSRAVDALVKEGLATRVEDPEDRRVRSGSRSRKGQATGRHPRRRSQSGDGGVRRDASPPRSGASSTRLSTR